MGTSPQKLFIIDDDGDHVLALTRSLKLQGLTATIEGTSDIEKVIQLLHGAAPHVVILDLSLKASEGPESGLRILREIRGLFPLIRVIVLTGHSSSEFGVRAIAEGAHAFLGKPAEPSHLKILIQDAFNNYSLRVELFELKKSNSNSSLLIGESEAIKKVREEIAFASQTSMPVLLTGETGTGKGVVAFAIHEATKKNTAPFVRYQPSLGNSELTYAELFGAKKGAYTGANEDRIGLLSLANGGTFFLDEVGELPASLQITLLGVLQDGLLRPLGDTSQLKSQFRLISATNQPLEVMVHEGLFRRDFFQRINHHHIELPTLRSRVDDIPLLAAHFLTTLAQKHDRSLCHLSDAAIMSLQTYSFPGNIRELEAIIERAAMWAQFNERIEISPSDLRIYKTSSIEPSTLSFSEQVHAFKLSLIEKALTEAEGNQVKAAKLLRIDRSSLRRLIAEK